MHVWGVSADNAASHKAFQDKCGITTQLMIDENGVVGQALGNWKGDCHGRSTVVIDDQDRVLRVYDPVKAAGHADMLLADLGIP